MRKSEFFGMAPTAAVELLAAAPVVHLAATNERGEPVLRTLHAVVLGGAIYFHGAPVGEKAEAIGRAAVIAAEEVVATIPSHVFDPERACPATTYYRSAQAHGVLEGVEDVGVKARVLQALMEKHQPDGGYRPITADDPLYRGAVRGIGVVRMGLGRVDGKAKLGQNRRPEELSRVVEFLWRRGEVSDLRAIELVLAANPGVAVPEFLRGPEGVQMACALGPADVEAACDLLDGAYWNEDVPRDTLARAHVGAQAWVGAREAETGRLIATGRAVSDRAKWAWLYDVSVAPAWRGRGVGRALVRLLLAHPAVRGARRVRLRTRDAQGLYRGFGFVEGSARHAEMELVRG